MSPTGVNDNGHYQYMGEGSIRRVHTTSGRPIHQIVWTVPEALMSMSAVTSGRPRSIDVATTQRSKGSRTVAARRTTTAAADGVDGTHPETGNLDRQHSVSHDFVAGGDKTSTLERRELPNFGQRHGGDDDPAFFVLGGPERFEGGFGQPVRSCQIPDQRMCVDNDHETSLAASFAAMLPALSSSKSSHVGT